MALTRKKGVHVNTLALVLFKDFHANATGSHVTLRERNSGARSGRELFKGSKDVASLLVCTQKQIFWLGDVNLS